MPSAALRVRAEFLGRFELRLHDGQPLRLPPSARGLLAYLAFHRGRPQLRERLLGLFWRHADPRRGRSCLTSALWRVRRALEDRGIAPSRFFHVEDKDSIAVRSEAVAWSDVDEVLALDRRIEAASPLDPSSARRLDDALALFRGPLLEDQFADWIDPERRRFHAIRLRFLRELLHHHRRLGDLERSVSLAEQYLGIDPLAEEIHRELIALHRLRGEPAKCIAQYERCREVLRRELDVAPSPETRALVDHDRRPTQAASAADRPTEKQLLGLLDELHTVVTRVDELQRQIRAALRKP